MTSEIEWGKIDVKEERDREKKDNSLKVFEELESFHLKSRKVLVVGRDMRR